MRVTDLFGSLLQAKAIYFTQQRWYLHITTRFFSVTLWWMRGRRTVPTFLKLQALKITFGVIEVGLSVCGTDINGAFCSRSVGWPRVQLHCNTTHKQLITAARMDTATQHLQWATVLLFFCYILSANNSAKHTDSIHLCSFNDFYFQLTCTDRILISEWVPSETSQ